MPRSNWTDSIARPAPQPEAVAEGEAAAAAPRRKPFRRLGAAMRMDADKAERQSRIAKLAWASLGGREAATQFLNNHDEDLGGRPLDVATASEEGLEAVSRAITARSGQA